MQQITAYAVVVNDEGNIIVSGVRGTLPAAELLKETVCDEYIAADCSCEVEVYIIETNFQ